MAEGPRKVFRIGQMAPFQGMLEAGVAQVSPKGVSSRLTESLRALNRG